MKKSLFSAIAMMTISLGFSSQEVCAKTVYSGQQMILEVGDPVAVLSPKGMPYLSVQQGAVTDVSYSRYGSVLYQIDGKSIYTGSIYSTSPGDCVKGTDRTLCVGDQVMEDLLFGTGTVVREVLGIQVVPTGFFSKSTHVLIKRGNEYIPQIIDNLVHAP